MQKIFFKTKVVSTLESVYALVDNTAGNLASDALKLLAVEPDFEYPVKDKLLLSVRKLCLNLKVRFLGLCEMFVNLQFILHLPYHNMKIKNPKTRREDLVMT